MVALLVFYLVCLVVNYLFGLCMLVLGVYCYLVLIKGFADFSAFRVLITDDGIVLVFECCFTNDCGSFD